MSANRDNESGAWAIGLFIAWGASIFALGAWHPAAGLTAMFIPPFIAAMTEPLSFDE